MWEKFVRNVRLRRFVVLMALVAGLFMAHKLINVILLTFIFTYMISRLINFVQRYARISDKIIVVALYGGIIAGLYFAVTIYLPKVIRQVEHLVRHLIHFYKNPPTDEAVQLVHMINHYLGNASILHQIQGSFGVIMKYLEGVGTFGFMFVMALLLSFFFSIERDELAVFAKSFLHGGYYSWIFRDIYYFGAKFVNTFGIVLEAQLMIAVCNTVITTICLGIMRMPQLLSLSLMIFILSMIPVAGVIISAIPLCLIGFSVGGINYVFYIIIMLICVHALESYVLNPHLMASKTELPIFFTFMVLFVAEHLFGIWGLIVGIPVFTFILDILEVKPISKKHEAYKQRRAQRQNSHEG